MTPFLAVFLSPHMEGAVGDETETDFPEEVRWCLQSDVFLSMLHCYMKWTGLMLFIYVLWHDKALAALSNICLSVCLTLARCWLILIQTGSAGHSAAAGKVKAALSHHVEISVCHERAWSRYPAHHCRLPYLQGQLYG